MEMAPPGEDHGQGRPVQAALADGAGRIVSDGHAVPGDGVKAGRSDAHAGREVRFRLLGSIEACGRGGRPIDVGPPRQRTVLAALLMSPQQSVPVDQLVQRVWGGHPPQRTRATLYTYLSRLRRLLPAQAAAISHAHGGYVLQADARSVDLHRFRDLLATARRTDDDVRAAESYRRALALWRGEAFLGIDTPWFNEIRTALCRERQAAELDYADVRLRLGEHAEALSVLAELSAAHPLDERVAALYMTALYRCGRQADALAHYRQMHTRLTDELGIDPGRDLQDLHQAVLGRDARLSAAATGVATPPARPSWPVQCQLPLAISGFVGRSAQIEDLQATLTGGSPVPVVLSGAPGVGKTALAVHIGHRLRTAFPDGQWYLRLHGVGERPREPSDALAELLRAAGMALEAIPETLEERAAAFRSRVADRRMLLILDDAAGAGQVRPLLPGTTGVSVLVTSRSDLRGLTASHTARTDMIDVLRPAEAQALLAGVLGEQRTGAEPEACAKVARLCAYLPMALRIAAANLAAQRRRSLASYAAELASRGRLAALSVPGDRHTAVRSVFDDTCARLDETSARLFVLLGVHPGPDFTAAAAAALLGSTEPAAVRLLDTLVTSGLLQRTAAERYRFNDLLRLYAAERAESDPGIPAAWQRLCSWYLETTETATAAAFGPSDGTSPPSGRSGAPTRFAHRSEALAWLEAEHVNLLSLILQAADKGPHEISWRLADRTRLYFAEGREP